MSDGFIDPATGFDASNVPTQVVYPWRAALRTGGQTFLAALGLAVLAAPLISEFVGQFWPDSPVIAWIGGGAAFAGALSTLITRIMALAPVNDFLTKIGLGANPAS